MARTDPPSDSPLTELDIQAFADGNLPPERAERVRKYLGSRPGEVDRVAFYRQLNMQMQHAFDGVFPQHVRMPSTGRVLILSFWSDVKRAFGGRTGAALFGAVLLVLAASGWFAASRVSEETLDAAGVMALTQAANQHGAGPQASPLSDPYVAELKQLGLTLVSTRTRHPGALAHIDEYDYRNVDGEAVVLLTASAPFATDKPHWTGQRVGDVRLLAWTQDGTRYVVAGHAKTHGLMRAADALSTH
jgi:anti-sigma factor RsiW